MEEYGRDLCIRSYTMVAGVLANFSPNSWTIPLVWHIRMVSSRFAAVIAWDGIEDDNEHLGSGL